MGYQTQSATSSQGLADVLERILDKGIVIAGDISVSLVGIELLSIRLRLLIATLDKAREMGINWWEGDPVLSSEANRLGEENAALRARLEAMEARLDGMAGLGVQDLLSAQTQPALEADTSLQTTSPRAPLGSPSIPGFQNPQPIFQHNRPQR